jgi:hypothetical protein
LRANWQTSTDVRKRDLFNRLANNLRGMAFDVQAMIALKCAEPDGDNKKSRSRVEKNGVSDEFFKCE